MTAVQLPPDVAHRIGRLLVLADEAMPDVVSGLHVVGSVALGDYQPGHSDIDLVVVTRHPLGAADVATVDAIHRQERAEAPEPAGPLQATYLTTSALATRVDASVPTVSYLDGTTQYGTDFEINPVTWRNLVRHAVAVRGNPTAKWMRDPRDADVVKFCRENLAGYWASQVETAAASADADPDAKVSAGWLEWVALGPARLLHTIETGEIISKSQAGNKMIDLVAAEERQAFELALASRHGAADPVPAHLLATAARAIHRLVLEPVVG